MIPFNNLLAPQRGLEEAVLQAVQRVLASGWFILGSEVEAFEAEFAAFHGLSHGVGVANGTDALELALRAGGIGPGDEVITVAHTAVATVCAIERTGATPVLADIDPISFTLDVRAAEAAVTARTRAIVPVHLYGHPADMPAVEALAARYGLLVVEDCAQAHGARLHGQYVGTFGHLAAFSFYPTKNLGALGDGGMVITRDAGLAARMKRLRNYGQVNRYHHVERGINSRLDEVQAAILRVKLPHLNAHNAMRRELAARYTARLVGTMLVPPAECAGYEHVYHLYVVRAGGGNRDACVEQFRERGVQTLIHYPVPVHLQPAYADLGYTEGSLPHTEAAAREVLSLPLHIGLTPHEVEQVVEAVYA